MLSHFMRRFETGICYFLCSILVALLVGCSLTDAVDNASLVEKLEAHLPRIIAGGNAPSMQVAVISRNQILWSKAFGANASTEHIYMNASVQKSFTALALLQLVERGLIDLDADVSDYLPFPLQHPDYPHTPVTVRMLLAHRSGLGDAPHQFGWDTGSAFSPQYRPSCPDHLLVMSLEEFLTASLTPVGANYTPEIWQNEPGRSYSYSVTVYPLLRYLIGHVSGHIYPDYMHENIFMPLGMLNSGFSAEEFAGRHAIPYTRIDGENIELPIWDGQGMMMRTTAEDMAKFLLVLINNGQYGDFQLVQPGKIELMQQRTTRFKVLFRNSDDLPRKGHGLGTFVFRGGWYGNGGSAPGFQCLARYHPAKQVGYVILSNVNAILGGGENYDSARSDIYEVQNALISILDPTFGIRRRSGEMCIVGALIVYTVFIGVRIFRKKK